MKKFAPEGSRPKQDSATGGSSDPVKVFTQIPLSISIPDRAMQEKASKKRQQDLLCKQLLLRKTRKKDIEDGQEQEEDSDGDDQDQIDEEEEAE